MTVEEKQAAIRKFCESRKADSCVAPNNICPLYDLPSTSCYNYCTDEEVDEHYRILFGENDTPENVEPNDDVNKAEHYNKGGIECIKAIEASMSPEEYRGFLKGQVVKYVWRYQHKGTPLKDLKKARYYLDDLIRVVEEVETDA